MSTIGLLIIVGQLFGSLLNLLPIQNFWIEINRNLSGYYLAAHVVTMAALAIRMANVRFRRQRVLTVLLLAALCLQYLLPIFPFFGLVRREAVPQHEDHLRILYANVHTENEDHLRLKQMIGAQDPDLVLLLEVSERWDRDLALAAQYPFRKVIPRDDNFGLGLYSKFPFDNQVQISLGEELPPVIIAKLQAPWKAPLMIALYHALPPMNEDHFQLDRLLHRRMITLLRNVSDDVVLAADMNATPWSGFYKLFLEGAKLSDAAEGYGLSRTWNAMNQLQRLTLDHVLFKGRLEVDRFQVLGDVGSDHFPLVVDFSWTGPID